MTRPGILILTMGGTIDKQYFDALSEYKIVDTLVGKLLANARVTHPFIVEELTRKDSLDLTQADRDRLIDRINASDAERVIVTHGTDTMAETARYLATKCSKTIVLVGAHSPARFSDSDAHFNLGMAFATAQLAAAGVYITMNGTVFRADEAIKDRARGTFVNRKRGAGTAERCAEGSAET